MTTNLSDRKVVPYDRGEPTDEISGAAVAIILLRRRRLVLGLAVAGMVVGLAIAMVSRRVYETSTTFVPEAASTSMPSGGLAFAASQFGIQLPNMGSKTTWGPTVYADLLESQDLLEPIARDTITVPELGDGPRTVMDLLEVPSGPSEAVRAERTVRKLRKLVSSSEDKQLGAAVLTVTTPWPSVSLELSDRLLRAVTHFNQVTRQSQTHAERQVAESLASVAQQELRSSEDRLQAFLQSNRVLNSPNLTFEHERLQRDVALHQSVYTSLLQSREEARIKEVREAPVVTILKSPRLPVTPKPRRAATKTILFGGAGLLLGMMLAFGAEWFASFRNSREPANREISRLLSEALPGPFRRLFS